MYFLVDRYSKSNWLALRTTGDQYLWSEIGYSAEGIQETLAQLMQEEDWPPVLQDAVTGVVGLATSPRLPQVALLSPVLQDCSPEDQIALEHIFARDILNPGSTGRQADGVPQSDLNASSMDTGEETTPLEEIQDPVVVNLGTVIPEQGANIRSGPGQRYEIVSAVPHGHLVAFVAESEDGEWLQLENGNWIYASLLSRSVLDSTTDIFVEAGPGLSQTTPEPSLAAVPTPQSALRLVQTEQGEIVEMEVLRGQALNHVNEARARAGLSPVRLGDNTAAQSHADEMAENQYLSHWNLAGLTPDMRYTRAGGEAYSAENVAFIGNIIGPECIDYDPLQYLESSLNGLMDSPGHRRNILKPEHTTLHLGISFNCRILTVVQLFSGEYVTFTKPPAFVEGRLVMEGRLHNGAALARTGPAEGVRISYRPPPHSLSRGQLFRAAGYCSGAPIASILVPLPAFYSYDPDGPSWSHTFCLTPYESDSQVQPPNDLSQASSLMEEAKEWEAAPQTYSGLEILPDIWRVGQDRFEVQADVSPVMAALGPGVYSILLWGEVNGSPTPVSEFAIFVE